LNDDTYDALCRLFRNISEIEKLSELGVLFLLFEMGLELSLDRLKVSLLQNPEEIACTHVATKGH
jgi:Kef-type K+ transport system membrane component KefB